MRCNPWLVALLAVMPLFILFVGLSAAAGGFDSRTAWALLAAGLVAAAVAARMAMRDAEQT